MPSPLPPGTRRKPCRAERSLYERANGYNYDAVKIFMPAGSKQPVVVHYTEHCPPDVGAAFIWLKNRDPERWRDVQNVEHVMGKRAMALPPLFWKRGTTAAPRRLVTLLGAPAPSPIADDAMHALVVSDEQHRAADPLDSATDVPSAQLHDIHP